jgi:hypothetical protein
LGAVVAAGDLRRLLVIARERLEGGIGKPMHDPVRSAGFLYTVEADDDVN